MNKQASLSFMRNAQALMRMKNWEFAMLCRRSEDAINDWRSGRNAPQGDALLIVVRELRKRGLLDQALG